MEPQRARLAAGATLLMWASAFPAITVAVHGLGPAGLSVARLVVASAVLGILAPFKGLRRPRRSDLPLIALCGLSGMTAYQLLLNTGERVVAPGTASLLIATAPVYSTLFASGFLGERAGRRQWAGSAVAVLGCAVLAVSQGLSFGTSALVVLAAAVAQGMFHAAQKPLLGRYTGFEVTVYAMWAGTLFVLPWTGALVHTLPRAGSSAILAAGFLGLVPSVTGFVLWAYAMARTAVGQLTTSLYLVPAAAIAMSFVWLGQLPSGVEMAGGATAIAGVIMANNQRIGPTEGAQVGRPGPSRCRRRHRRARSAPADCSVEGLGCPASTSALRTYVRSVSWLTDGLAEMGSTAFHGLGCSPWWSKTMRTARSRNSAG